jgi:hypothetical protein
MDQSISDNFEIVWYMDSKIVLGSGTSGSHADRGEYGFVRIYSFHLHIDAPRCHDLPHNADCEGLALFLAS